MDQEPQRKSSSAIFILALIPVVVFSIYAWKTMNAESEDEGLNDAAFNLSEKPDTETEAFHYVSKLEREQQARTSSSDSGLGGVVTETSKIYSRKGRRKLTQREKEKEFIKKYDHLIKKEQERLGKITEKYYRKHAVVRAVDRDFARSKGLMKAHAQYAKDRDAHKWARTVISQKDVRQKILKHSKNPEVWKVALGMMLEALKKPPPKPIHKEMARFMTGDEKMSKYVTNFTKQVIPNMASMITSSAPPGADLRGLSKLGAALTGMSDPLKKKKKKKKRTASKRKPRPTR